MSAPVKLLIDTNVWLDYFFDERGGHQQAFALLNAACRREAQIYYPYTSLQDVFYLAGVSLKRKARQKTGELTESQAGSISAACWGFTEAMAEFGVPVGADASDFWLARKYRRLHADLEDNFVLAAAQRASADVLVTNDVKLIRHAPMCAMTPQDALGYLTLSDAD